MVHKMTCHSEEPRSGDEESRRRAARLFSRKNRSLRVTCKVTYKCHSEEEHRDDEESRRRAARLFGRKNRSLRVTEKRREP
jgi:hypothetical protein